MDNVVFEEGDSTDYVFEKSADLYQPGCITRNSTTVKVVEEWLLIYRPTDVSLERIPGTVLED